MHVRRHILLVAALASAFVFIGCETEPATGSTSTSPQSGAQPGTNSGSLSISPQSWTASNQQRTRTFTASGGSGNYEWSLGNGQYGSLDRNNGSSVTYTSNYSGTAEVRDTITVRDTLEGTSATATVTHRPYAGNGNITIGGT